MERGIAVGQPMAVTIFGWQAGAAVAAASTKGTGRDSLGYGSRRTSSHRAESSCESGGVVG
jgi:hypothetical protein